MVLVSYTKRFARNRPTASYRFFVHFAHEVVPPKLEKGIANLNCTAVVLGIGSWIAGYPDGRPHLLDEFKSEMTKVIVGMVNMTNAFVQPIHYHPLSDILTTCPPVDWRSPRVIDMYNEILRQVCDEQGVPFIDTNSLAFSSPLFYDERPGLSNFSTLLVLHDGDTFFLSSRH